jgi:DNA-binding XRE family transcriptional regulator
MTARPVWLFDSPLLRRALADMNLPAVPAIVRAACGLSQRDLAVVVGWSPAALSYYERGVRDGLFDIRMALQFADAVGMPRAALLPLVFADPDAGLAAGARTGTDPGRLEGGGPAAGGWAAGVLAPAGVSRTVSTSHVRYWRACTEVAYARGRAAGGTALLVPVLSQWQRAWVAAREGSASQVGGQLLETAGELALCTGWLALDAGRPQLAARLHTQASALAGAAGGSVLAVHVLISGSMLAAEMARAGPSREPARQALRLALQAQEEGRYLPIPALHALIALHHAAAAALLGDTTAFGAAIRRARRELDHRPRDGDPPTWLRFVDEAEITGTEANGWLDLGETHHAARLYQQVLAGELSPCRRASYGTGLAHALLTQGAGDGAVAAAAGVLATIEAGMTSMRCLNRLRPVRIAAGTTPSAQQFRDRFDAISHALAAYDQPGDDPPHTTTSVPASPRRGGIRAGADG